MLRLAEGIDRAIGAALRPLLFAGMAALIVSITLQVVTRVFFTAFGWTEEVARFLLVWLTFLGSVYAWHEHRHIAVTVLVERLPDAARRAATIVALVLALAFLLSLAWVGYEYMSIQSFQKSAAMRLPMSYVYAIIPVSALLMAWFCLSDLLRAILAGKTPEFAEPAE
ncbi:TRAP transporter small permease [Tropicimonas sp. IMCC34043]|uniref:TRAP transporter small permease n=1 Tax=Tropicimonas sp. IMCC34043 TaxID=2248760 RepID=UPI0018E554B2|nr:TRAP transporter small permease [Tropicimonas sp. IMCC34043]